MAKIFTLAHVFQNPIRMKSKLYILLFSLCCFCFSTFSEAQTTNCPLPLGPAATSVSSNTVVFSWQPQSTSAYFQIQYRPVALNPVNWTQLYAQGTSYTLTNLTCGTTYEWQIQTICGNSAGTTLTSGFTTSLQFTTAACASVCMEPMGLQSSNVTTSSATVSWTPVSNVGAYKIQYRPSGSTAAWGMAIAQNGSSYTLTNLTCGTTYEWEVQSVCNTSTPNGSSNFSTMAFFTTSACSTVTCATPSGLTSTAVTATSASLAWGVNNPAAAYYQLRYKLVNSTTWTTVSVQGNPVYTLGGLTCASTYEWQVKAICSNSGTSGGSSAFSASSTFTTLACTTPTCNPPAGLVATAITANSATLGWGLVSGVQQYNIRYRPSTVSGTTWLTATATPNGVTQLANLLCGTAYEWQVQSVCNTSAVGGISAFSSSAFFTTLACATTCTTPTGVITSAISATSVNMMWTAVAGVSVYQVQYRPITAVATNWTQKTVQGLNTMVSGLTCNTLYEWQVASVCSNNNGTSTVSAFTTPISFTTAACPTTCPVPSGLNSANVSSSYAYLNWTAQAGVIAYRVQYRVVTPNVPPTSTPWTQVTTTTNSISLTTLVCNSVYEWQVQSLCNTTSNGASAFSSSATFTTQPCLINCPTPGNLTAINTSATSTLLKWNPSNGMPLYNIRYRKINTTTWTTATSSVASKQLSGLTPQSYYEWQVQSICNPVSGSTAGTPSAWSASAYFHTIFVVLVGPNPADRILKLEMELNKDDESASIELRNMLGAVVYQADKSLTEGRNEMEIATSNLSEGLYFLTVSTKEGKQVSKVYIRH